MNKCTTPLKRIFIVITILSLLFACNDKNNTNKEKTTVTLEKKEPIIKDFGFTFNDFKVVKDTIKSGDTFGTILQDYTFPIV